MHKRKHIGVNLLFTVPLLFIFTTVVIIPFITGIYYSFFKWDGIPADPKIFVGFGNFAKTIHDTRFLTSAWHTIEFTIMAVILVNILGLVFALIVTTKFPTVKAARTMLFMPNLIGGLILGYIWKFIFTDGFQILSNMTGLHNIFFDWLLSPQFSLYGMVIVFAWQMAGYTMIIYLAGIQALPNEILEASRVDGANSWQRLIKIICPLLMPSFTICLFLTLANAFNIYDINLSLTNGGPVNSTELFSMNIYNEIFSNSNYGYGQAKAVIFFIIVTIITLTQVSITKKREVEM